MDAAARAYYEQRAPEYDDWWEGTGLFADRERPGWHEDVAALIGVLEALRPARTVDLGCGTGFLTRHLPGAVTGLDQSAAMLAIAAGRCPGAAFLPGDVLAPPFPDGAFERVVASHVYGHLEPRDRARFLAEAARIGGELVVVDSAVRPEVEPERWEERVLGDGSRHRVFKRRFTGEGLAAELGGAEVRHDGPWFVVALRRA